MAERLAPSATQKQIFEQSGITNVESLIYADLRRAGWSKPDAFYAAYRHIYGNALHKDQKRIIEALENDSAIKKRIEVGKTTETDRIPLQDLARETSKEKILSDLVLARKRTREGTKEWTDLTKAIADYAKIKQDDIKTDEQPIRYYIPLKYPRSCDECIIYQNKKAEGLHGSK